MDCGSPQGSNEFQARCTGLTLDGFWCYWIGEGDDYSGCLTDYVMEIPGFTWWATTLDYLKWIKGAEATLKIPAHEQGFGFALFPSNVVQEELPSPQEIRRRFLAKDPEGAIVIGDVSHGTISVYEPDERFILPSERTCVSLQRPLRTDKQFFSPAKYTTIRI